MARLLVCNTHKTVDVMPDYDTANDMEGRHDVELKLAIDRHLDKYGSDPGRHRSMIIRIEDEELDLIGKDRIKQALQDNRLQKFLQEEREQKKEDALACYNLHNRPTYGAGYGSGCVDYHNESRRIGSPGSGLYLCDFCPYNSYVEHDKNKKIKFRGEK